MFQCSSRAHHVQPPGRSRLLRVDLRQEHPQSAASRLHDRLLRGDARRRGSQRRQQGTDPQEGARGTSGLCAKFSLFTRFVRVP